MSYLLVYFIILLLFYLAVQMKYSKRNYKKVVFYILIILVILIPSLFAGLRSINIGTDTRGYLSNDFNMSIRYSNLLGVMKTTNEEAGFISLIFICTRIFSSIHSSMFIIEVIIMSFITAYALKSKTKGEALSIMFCYLFLGFGESLCIMRQHIAFAMLLFSLKSFENKNYFKTLLLFVLAYLFHSSTIVFALVYLFLHIMNNNNEKKTKKGYFIICLISTILILNIVPILRFSINVINFLPTRYNLYVSSEWFYSQNRLNIFSMRLFLNVLFIILYFICYKIETNKSNRKKDLFSIALMIINLIIYIGSRKYLILSRFGIYFFNTAILYNSNFIDSLSFKENMFQENNGLNRFILRIIFVILILASFYGTVILNNNNYNLYPYVSILAG